ncbi:MAG: hypothetical protein P3T54_08590 [Dehalogenimonas sp.]|uniref:Uncharacterized protein n=1 Tax=Candidatus Dehalogenimonas loeffleri TaxID=3127115 RepID=A0ABZ2J1T5_9CHLR|nr:hypothetical protein [Dehalogenimonas sp.]
MGNSEEKSYQTRQERRDKKRAARHSRMTHHGKSIALIYRHSVEKRTGGKEAI